MSEAKEWLYVGSHIIHLKKVLYMEYDSEREELHVRFVGGIDLIVEDIPESIDDILEEL